MDVIKSVAVDLLHNVGSCPSARTKDIGVRNALSMEITGKKVP